ncbi:MAG: hypothetical protein KIG68_09410 [Oxalobacter sp.]|nr:hypothetical protein [Oxalobacter sp.]
MATKTLSDVRLILRNDTTANWTSGDPVLLKGEIGIESDTARFKIGDGTSAWTALPYAGAIIAQSSTNGNITVNGTDITVYTLPVASSSVIGGVKSGGNITVNGSTGAVTVNEATKATQLKTARTVSLTDDVTASTTWSAAGALTLACTLAASGVTAGTYTKVTVDAKGRVTAATNLAASDITGLLGTAATKNTGTGSGNVPVLDSNGKLSTSVLPSLSIMDVYTVANQAAMLALTCQKGDIAIRTDENKTYILSGDSPSTLANWKELLTPTDAVTSVNNKTGAVTLTTSDISEGTNLYWTAARFNSAFAAKASTDLSDTSDIVRYSDTGIIINCGNA